MRYLILALSLLISPAAATYAQVTIGIGVALPGVNIGINLPMYPYLVRVPGYPVYYAPRLDVNFFFYDGLYWVYADDRWYAGNWYNGPWFEVEPEYVPLFVLRIPVRYYRRPPAYFSDWRLDRPPRWGKYWGPAWARQHRGWDHWSRPSVPLAAPLPHYQRDYSGDRYPGSVEQQDRIRSRHYRYQPHEPVIQQHSQPRSQQQELRPQWQRQQEPSWQQQRQAPAQSQRQQQQGPQWQQWQQQQGNHHGRSRAEQRQPVPDAQYSPVLPQQKMHPKKRPPNPWLPEIEQ